MASRHRRCGKPYRSHHRSSGNLQGSRIAEKKLKLTSGSANEEQSQNAAQRQPASGERHQQTCGQHAAREAASTAVHPALRSLPRRAYSGRSLFIPCSSSERYYYCRRLYLPRVGERYRHRGYVTRLWPIRRQTQAAQRQPARSRAAPTGLRPACGTRGGKHSNPSGVWKPRRTFLFPAAAANATTTAGASTSLVPANATDIEGM